MRKRTALLGIVIGILAFEFVCAFIFFVMRGSFFASHVFEKKMIAIQEEPGVRIIMQNNGNEKYILNQHIHPFLGYAQVSKNTAEDIGFGRAVHLKSLQHNNTVTIGIFGGSFARQFTDMARKSLRESLEKMPEFSGKKIVIVTPALGGAKQPQQLMALVYLLLLETRLDFVINIDGYNESTLHFSKPESKRASVLYPRNWYDNLLALSTNTPDGLMRGEVVYLQHKRSKRASAIANSPFRHSAIVVMGLHVLDTIDRRRLRDVREQYSNTTQIDAHIRTDGILGPTNIALGLPEDDRDALVDLWDQSSRMMHRISRAFGSTYIHILQPNQYVDGSKIFGKEERQQAIDYDQFYAKYVPDIYPKFLERGKAMQQNGIHFFDGTMVFTQRSEPLYVDTCCHLNAAGYKAFAPFVANAIKESLR